MQVLHNRQTTKFVKRLFNNRYEVSVPEFQRPPNGHGTMDYEPERTRSMEEHLKQGDMLFDIGVADGWMSAIYAKFVGAENMCMFEPSASVWSNIKAVWDANGLETPRHTFWGFVGDTTQLIPREPLMDNEFLGHRDGWPLMAYSDTMIEEMCFRSLLSTARNIPQTTIDDFVSRTKIIPKGISLDVEGAELLVLRGAVQTLLRHKPLVWLSLHDLSGAISYDYHSSKEEVLSFLSNLDYKYTWLEDYGDSHWLCEPKFC